MHLMVIIRLVQPRGGEDVRGSVQLIDLTRVSPVISRIDDFQSGLVSPHREWRCAMVRTGENDGRIIVITAGPAWQVGLDITIIIVGHMSRCPGNREILTITLPPPPSLPHTC